MRESDIYKKIKDKLGEELFLQRIESGGTGSGIPDIFYSKDKGSIGWIELKAVKMTPRKNVLEVPFRPGQMPWIKRYLKYCNNIFLFLHIENRYIENTLSIFKGNQICFRYYYNVLDAETCYHQAWNKVDWNEVLNLL